MADFVLALIATDAPYSLYSATVSDIDGNFQHTFRKPSGTRDFAIVHLGMYVESMAGMPVVQDQGVLFTGRKDESLYKMWRRLTMPFLKTLDSMVSAEIQLEYPVTLRDGENVLVQSKEIDTYATPTGDATIIFTVRDTWAQLTDDIKRSRL